MTGRAKNAGRGRNKKPPGRGRKKKKKVDHKKFWGDDSAMPVQNTDKIRISEQPDAVIKSLGAPPLDISQNISEAQFSTIYTRSVMLASALAAAGDLLETDEA